MIETDYELRIIAESECAKAEDDWGSLFSGTQEGLIQTWIDGYNYRAKEALSGKLKPSD